MTDETQMNLKRTARIVGVLYILLTVIAPFSILYIPSIMVVPGDAAATAGNIIASEGLFRVGMIGQAAIFLIEVVLVAFLYTLLKPVNETLSRAAAFARLAMAVVQGINLLNHFIVLLLLSGADYLAVFEPAQLHALALVFLNLHAHVTLIWGLFFGLHLLVLGYLVLRSGYIAGWVGILLLVTSLSYFIQNAGMMIVPQHAAILEWFGYLSMVELAFPLWLLIKGVRDRP